VGDVLLCSDVKIYTLGNFEIYRGENNITRDVNKNSKYWQLLYYLLTYRNKKIAREKLILELGLNKNSDPESALSALVYRLRQKLADGDSGPKSYFIKTAGNAYTLNKSWNYWLDVEVFENLCSTINQGCSSKNALRFFSRILELYRGDYLEDVQLKEWFWHTRDYYRDFLVKTLLQLDNMLSGVKDYNRLREFYSRVQQLICFDERLMIGAVETLLKSGHQGLALNKYREIVDWFEKNNLALPARFKNLKKTIIRGVDREPGCFFEKLQKKSAKKEGLIKDRDLFIRLCKLEKRRTKRDLICRFLLQIKLAGYRGPNRRVRREIADKLSEHILKQIRSGDVFCRWSDDHFFLLLFDITKKEVDKFIKRLENTFAAGYKLSEELDINSEIFRL